MKDYIKRMIDEHKELVVRIQKLHAYVYSNASNEDCKVEFANKCIQLSAMKKYEEALRARLENAGVKFDCDNQTYNVVIDAIEDKEPDDEHQSGAPCNDKD